MLRYSKIAWVLLVFISGCQPEEKKPMNVLMICIDDMNNWIGALDGQAITPNIDRLANQGILFTNAYCVLPACNPSRTAIMTGQRPETTGQFTNAGNFRDKPGGKDRITLPQFLMNNGYTAVGAGKVYHKPRGKKEIPEIVSDPSSWDEQWVGNVGTSGSQLYLDDNGVAKWHGDTTINKYLSYSGIWGPCPEPKDETGDWKMATFCADFLKESHEKPFFLACGIFRPHAPQLAPQEFFDLYPTDKIEMPEVPEDDMDDIPEIAQMNFSTEFTHLVREKGEWEKAVQGYLASMSFADACVGKVMDALAESEYADNTMVVLWTDHGWQLGHKNRWEKYSLWKQGTQTPLIIYSPDVANYGKKVNKAVSLLDLYPTLADILELEKPDFLEGTSVKPLLIDTESDRDVPAIITYPEGSHSVVMDEWSYIHYKDGSEELYNHESDPKEFANLAILPEHRERMDEMKKWISDL